jgi:hypothetical protein
MATPFSICLDKGRKQILLLSEMEDTTAPGMIASRKRFFEPS